MDICETFRDCRTAIPLSSLKVSCLDTISCGLYESPNEQNWMCELCTFSQIQSQMVFGLILCDLAQESYGLFSNDMQKHMKSMSAMVTDC